MRVTVHQAVDMMACHGFLPCKLRRGAFTLDLPVHEFSLLLGTSLNSLVDGYQLGLNRHTPIKEATTSARPTPLKRTHLRRLLSNRYEAYCKLSPSSYDSHNRPAHSHLKKQQVVDDHFSAKSPRLGDHPGVAVLKYFYCHLHLRRGVGKASRHRGWLAGITGVQSGSHQVPHCPMPRISVAPAPLNSL